MKYILNLSLIATAFLTLAALPLSAASNDAEIARGDRGGFEGGRGNFEGEAHMQHQGNYNQQHYRQNNWNNEQRRNWNNNAERRDWQYRQDRYMENQIQNEYAPVVPYYDGSDGTYPDDGSSQQNNNNNGNNNSDQQNDDSNFDSQIWDFNK